MLRSAGARRRTRRVWSVLTALLFVGVWFAPTAASAHSAVVRTTPTGTVRSAPDAVHLDFNEPPRARFSVVHVVGPDGQRRDGGTLSVLDDTVTQPLTGSRPAGVYTVDWRVVSADGHPVSGRWQFTAAAAAATLPSIAAAPAGAGGSGGSGGAHLAHAALAIVIVVLLGLWWLGERLWKRRKARS